MRAMTTQASFETIFSTKLDTIKRCRDAFNDEATLCFQENSTRSSQVGLDTNQISKAVYQKVCDMDQLLLAVLQEQSQTHIEVEERKKADANKRREDRKLLEQNVIALNRVRILLNSSPVLVSTQTVQCKFVSVHIP